MNLDISSLENAVDRLQQGLYRYQSDFSDDQIRDGLIHRFEIIYDLSHKMLKRFLVEASANPAEYDEISFQDLIRGGNEQGLLLGDWSNWRTYRDMRARTSHTYDEKVALQVVAAIPDFLSEARHLLERLSERLG